MKISLAHLGPTGTNTETAALAYADWLASSKEQEAILCPYPSIAMTLQSVAQGDVKLAVVPIENSIEGSVTIVLDTLWRSPNLKILQGLTIPISHGLLSFNPSLEQLKTVYSHPQALAQCQQWLEQFLPQVQLISTKSTTEALEFLKDDLTAAAISAPRAAQLYDVPLLREDIKDRLDNCTRFWIIGTANSDNYYQDLYYQDLGDYLSLAFSLPRNSPGALVAALQIFARRGINLSKIESRPTKRSLGEYIFFIDVEGNSHDPAIKAALSDLSACTEVLKIFGNYSLLPMSV